MLTEVQKKEAIRHKNIDNLIERIRSGEVIKLMPHSSLTPDTADLVEDFLNQHTNIIRAKLEAMTIYDLFEVIEDECREYGFSQAMDCYSYSDVEIDKEKAKNEIIRRLGDNA